MTQRERQILQWIEENPMISQEELAQKLDVLLTKGLDLGIMIDGLEKLTIKEQIENNCT